MNVTQTDCVTFDKIALSLAALRKACFSSGRLSLLFLIGGNFPIYMAWLQCIHNNSFRGTVNDLSLAPFFIKRGNKIKFIQRIENKWRDSLL